jgi:hypothetical protein
MKPINFEWTPLEGVTEYRLTFRDGDTGELLARSEPLTEPRYEFDPSVGEGHQIEARLGIRREGADSGPEEGAQEDTKGQQDTGQEDAADDSWEDWGPDVPVQVLENADEGTVLTWEAVSPVHRLSIADQTDGKTVVDLPVLGSSYTYVPGAEAGHDLVMRVRAWREGEWEPGGEWHPLPLRVMLGEEREPPAPLAADKDADLLLVFTIDTEGFLARQKDPNPETTVEELIFGNFGAQENRGIGLHMDLLEHFGYRGCFFLDVLSAYQYGEDELKRAVEAIKSRGHEIQLHLHDEHVRNSDDPSIRALAGDLNAKDRDQFRTILELGIDVFERLVGNRPIAYRAGGYRITDEHFPVLEELGIRFDSSVNAYFHSAVSDWMRTRTQPHWIGDVLELPVTWTMVRDHRDAPETRAFAPNATAGDPISIMPGSSTDVPLVATYVSHSLELMRMDREVSAEELATFEKNVRARVRDEIAENVIKEVSAGPRLINGELDEDLVYRVAGLLRRIADRDDARCVTFTELGEVTDRFPRERRLAPVDPVPAIDRPHGAVTVTGTRIYSEALLDQLGEADGSKRRGGKADDDGAVTTLANADVAWKGSDVAVIGDESSDVKEWLDRREVGSTEHHELPSEKASGKFDVVTWTTGFEQSDPAALGERLATAVGMLRDEGALVLRVRTLGVAPAAERDGRPPLSELVFAGAQQPDITAWDAPTFSAWLATQGLDVVAERRLARPSADLKAVDRFRDKLGAIPDEEMETAAVDFTLRRAPELEEPKANEPETEAPEAEKPESEPTDGEDDRDASDLLSRFPVIAEGDDVLEITGTEGSAATEISTEDVTAATAAAESLVDGTVEPESSDVILCHETLERIDLGRLDAASRALYKTLRPGGHLLLRVARENAGPATDTTILVSLLRAGLEAVAAEPQGDLSYFRLIRPIELPDIVRFAGISAGAPAA